jgi:hypothetical protein
MQDVNNTIITRSGLLDWSTHFWFIRPVSSNFSEVYINKDICEAMRKELEYINMEEIMTTRLEFSYVCSIAGVLMHSLLRLWYFMP